MNAPVSKTGMGGFVHRGFESLPLRSFPRNLPICGRFLFCLGGRSGGRRRGRSSAAHNRLFRGVRLPALFPQSAFRRCLARSLAFRQGRRRGDSAASASEPGNRCPYRSSVTVIDEWPMNVCSALALTPAAIISAGERVAAFVKRHRRDVRASPSALGPLRDRRRANGVPSARPNTSSSSRARVMRGAGRNAGLPGLTPDRCRTVGAGLRCDQDAAVIRQLVGSPVRQHEALGSAVAARGSSRRRGVPLARRCGGHF